MHWYRVELDSTGHAVSCSEVDYEEVRTNARTVVYVRAESETAAKAIAYDRYRERQRKALQERRDRHAKAGRCQCVGRLDSPGKKCSRCNASARDSKARARLRAKGIPAPTPSKVEAFAETKELRERELRKAVLLEVKAAWRAAPNVPMFIQRLDRMIAECG